MRVLIVDDSPFVRSVLRETLSNFADVEIVGEAGNGEEAILLAESRNPDVVTMDLLMPLMNGQAALETIMQRCPVPVVIVADVDECNSRIAMDAMANGAVDVFPKPRIGFGVGHAEALITTLRAAARTEVAIVKRSTSRTCLPNRISVSAIGIVASTGGPPAICQLISALAKDSPPVVIVQHTDPQFADALVSWLARETGRDVQFARHGEHLCRGQVLIAPPGGHSRISANLRIAVSGEPPEDSHRPSGSVLLRSLATACGSRALGIVLTGMGRDGARGMRALAELGGTAVVQEPASAIAKGMPVAAASVSDSVLEANLEDLCAWIGTEVS